MMFPTRSATEAALQCLCRVSVKWEYIIISLSFKKMKLLPVFSVGMESSVERNAPAISAEDPG